MISPAPDRLRDSAGYAEGSCRTALPHTTIDVIIFGHMIMNDAATIVALATPPGVGAIGVIRLSGTEAVTIADKIFKGKQLSRQASHTLHFGHIVDVATGSLIDEVVVSLYLAPRSYTGEHVVEISCHGSPFILQQVVNACTGAGAVPARAGEFTQRAFLNGKLDLTQAEAVADLIASQSSSAQKAALHNLRGGFSNTLKAMRDELIHFSALIELELDFSEEDVEFADRKQFYALLDRISQTTRELILSFKLGNVVRHGVSVAIIGKPNAGKSTLLNALLQEERAIVSDIAGTTRDTIEEVVNIDGLLFRLIDTAGIRGEATDAIELIGIGRSYHNAETADLVLHLIDLSAGDYVEDELRVWLQGKDKKVITVYNKYDLWNSPELLPPGVFISAKTGEGMDRLKGTMHKLVLRDEVAGDSTLVTNTRHYAALQQVAAALDDIRAGMDQHISGDLLALDIRRALHYIGEITGEVQTDRDILGTIFGKFCIGK